MAASPRLSTLATQWLQLDRKENTRKEIEKLVESGNEKELEDRLGSRLEFGEIVCTFVMCASSQICD
jgi:hypothetical protein